MEKNFKVRVTQNFQDIQENMKLYTASTIRFLDYQRAWELEKKGLIKVMEVRKCKYE